MVDSLSKLGDAAGVKVETVADRSFKINGLVTIRSILQNWSGRDIVFDVVGKSVRIDKDDIYKVRSSNQPLAKQAYLLWAMVEDNLNQQGIVFPK